MKRILLLSLMLLGWTSEAQVSLNRSNSSHVFPGLYTYKNYITNPSAWHNATVGTATSSAAIARDTDAADALDGKASFTCDTSAQNGYCEWTTENISQGDLSGNCAATALVKGDGSLYRLQAHDGTNLLAQSPVIGSQSDWTEVVVNYPCGSTRRVRLTQTEAGTSPVLNIGRVFWGKAPNLSGSAIVSNWQSYTPTTGGTTGFGTITSGSGFWRQVGDSIEIQATFTAGTVAAATGAISIPSQFTIASSRLSISANTTAAAGAKVGEYTVNAGTNAKGALVTAPGTSTSLVYFAPVTAIGTTHLIPSSGISGDVGVTGSVIAVKFTVPVNELLGSQSAINSNSLPNWGYVRTAGTSLCSWSRNSNASFANFTADTDCPVPSLAGAATAPATKVPGMTISLPAGRYRFTAMSSFKSVTASTACSWRVSDGTNNSTVAVTETDAQAAVSSPALVMYMDLSSAVTGSTFQIQGTGTYSAATCNIDSDITGLREFSMLVEPVDRVGVAPLLVGSVTSNSAGLERIERAVVTPTNGSTCTVNSQSGSFIASTTPSATGDCTLTFSVPFISQPSCVVTAIDPNNPGVVAKAARIASLSTSSLRFLVEQIDETVAFASSISLQPFQTNIICIGPK